MPIIWKNLFDLWVCLTVFIDTVSDLERRMMTLQKQGKTNSLQDFSRIEAIEENGHLLFKGGGQGFMLLVESVDGSFFDASDWSQLQDQLRPLLLLQESEELQICFSKRCDLEGLVEKKIMEMNLAGNEFSRKLLLKDLNELIKRIDLDEPNLFTTKIILTYSQARQKHQSQDILEDIHQKRSFIQRMLQQHSVDAELLNREQVIEQMATFASGLTYIQSPSVQDEWPSVSITPREVRVDDHIFRSIVLKHLPENFSEMGMIRTLTDLPIPFDLCVRLTGKDHDSIKRRLERKKRVLYGLSNQRASGDPESKHRFEELEQILQRLNDSQDTLLDMTFTMGLRNRPQNSIFARQALTEILQAQSRLGHLRFEETSLGTFDCLLETIPGFKGRVFHQQSLLASNAVHFLPLFGKEAGDDRPIATYETRQGGLFSIHPFHYQLANHNWLISGTSGAGKSFFVNSILLKSISLQPRIFIIDIGGSYHKLTQFLGGESIGLDVQKGFKVGPFFVPPSKDVREESRRREHIQMVFWELLRDENRLPSVEARGLLREVLEPYLDSAALPEHPISAVRDDLKAIAGPEARRMALFLERWCSPSFFGEFLDHNEPVQSENSVVMFDLKGLNDFEDLSRVVQLIVCSSVWNSIRTDSSKFKFVVLDEVAFSLLKWQPDFVDELISTVRKHNAGVMVVAQDLEKITSNPAGASILQNTQMKAILQQRGDQRNFATPLQLTDPELDTISSLERRKGAFSDIFLMIDDRRTVIRFAPNLLEYYLATTVPQENRYLEKQLKRYQGEYHEKMYQFIEEYGK